jgi:hypothetical protein
MLYRYSVQIVEDFGSSRVSPEQILRNRGCVATWYRPPFSMRKISPVQIGDTVRLDDLAMNLLVAGHSNIKTFLIQRSKNQTLARKISQITWN